MSKFTSHLVIDRVRDLRSYSGFFILRLHPGRVPGILSMQPAGGKETEYHVGGFMGQVCKWSPSLLLMFHCAESNHKPSLNCKGGWEV